MAIEEAPKVEQQLNTVPSHPSSTDLKPEQQEKQTPPPPEEDDETEAAPDAPTGIALYLLFLALCLASFLVALDMTIIATAIPHITSAFNSTDDIGWYGSAFLLPTCGFQLFFGKLYTYLSIKWTFLISVVIFEIGSAIAGAAPTSTALIIGRAVAGTGSAGIFSGVFLILARVVPLRRRPLYAGMLGAFFGTASVCGPLLGGVFTDKLSWRWCFYVNLPCGAVTVLVIIFCLKSSKVVNSDVANESWTGILLRFDAPGTIVFLPAIVCLLLALQWGGTTYAWSDSKIIALLVLFSVLIVIWAGIQIWQGDRATLPLRILRRRSMSCGLLFVFCIGGSFVLLLYYVAVWFQVVKGDSAVGSGIDTLPMVLGSIVFAGLAGVGTYFIGYYVPFMLLAPVLLATGAGLMTTWSPTSTKAAWLGYQILVGAGIGIAVEQPTLAAQAVLPRADVPTGTAMMSFGNTLGGALFVSVAQNVFSKKLIVALAEKAAQVDGAILASSGATSIRGIVESRYGEAVMREVLEAYNEALTQTFMVSAILAAIAIVGALGMEWKKINRKKVKKDETEKSDVEVATEV